MDPCYRQDGTDGGERITELRGLMRARVMVKALRARRVDVSGGIWVGCRPEPLPEEQVEFSSFYCWEFLREMESTMTVRDSPQLWVYEKINL